MTEEELIEWIKENSPGEGKHLLEGIGDDCAICRLPEESELVVSTDILLEGRHFLFSTATPGDIGWKIGAANLSDIAAMGAEPIGFFLSAAFPAHRQDLFLDVMRGLFEILVKYNTPLAGGDISSGEIFFFSATVMGRLHRGCALRRSAACDRDDIYITGTPGYSSAGLRILLDKFDRGRDRSFIEKSKIPFVNKHLRPEPLLDVGKFLSTHSAVRACIDTSDGIAKDLRQICAASNVGAIIDEDAVKKLCGEPFPTFEDVLGGGEDYELLFTVNEMGRDDFLEKYRKMKDFPSLRRIGRICSEHPGIVTLVDRKGREQALPVKGYDHFSS